MSKRHQQLKRERRRRAERRCIYMDHETGVRCKTEGVECRLRDVQAGEAVTDQTVIEYFCGEHAHAAGYCRCCGDFWGGVSAFDFNPSGLCPHCQDQIDADFSEPGDEETSFDTELEREEYWNRIL